jgi:SAM-dependent methyltransferase
MKNINTEEPDIHWGFLDIKDKTILDLGCGRWYSSISTAEWFLNKGAKKVIGVDLSALSIEDERFTMKVEGISSTEQLQSLINQYLPDVIKCDIEGAELYFDSVETLPDEVKQFAVEYHDNTTKIICENAMRRWGFINIEEYTLLGHDINRIGVIHGWK